jgi:hypothetical protein
MASHANLPLLPLVSYRIEQQNHASFFLRGLKNERMLQAPFTFTVAPPKIPGAPGIPGIGAIPIPGAPGNPGATFKIPTFAVPGAPGIPGAQPAPGAAPGAAPGGIPGVPAIPVIGSLPTNNKKFFKPPNAFNFGP